MRSFHAVFAVVVTTLAALPAWSQQAGDTCEPATDADTCANSTTILSCDPADNTWQDFVCPDISRGSACADIPCAGSSCSTFDFATCVASRGAPCIGIRGLFTGENTVMAVPCAAGSACTMNEAQGTQTCTAFGPGVTNCAPGDEFVRCEGDLMVACINIDANNVIASPGVRDCGAEGLTCVISEEGASCAPAAGDPRCGSGGNGNGSCVNNVAHECSEGVVVNSTDCTNTGRACVVDRGSPSCVTADEECGPSGLGECNGSVANICVGGSFLNTTDCAGVGRVCGAVDANGQIGCVVRGGGGEGEGEGEGEPECRSDADCDDDETCEDGECERERSGGGRGRGNGEEEPGSSFCANSGAGMPIALAMIGLALRRRRR